MNQEQRFFVSLGLMLSILLLWTVLFPAHPEMPEQRQPESQTAPIAVQDSQSHPAQGQDLMGQEFSSEFKIGKFDLGVGQEFGGLRDLQIDGEKLLHQTNPGVLEIQQMEPEAKPLKFSSRTVEGALISEARLAEDGVQVRREISASGKEGPYLLICSLTVTNDSDSPKQPHLRFVVHRPLHAKDGKDANLAGITARWGDRVQAISVKPGGSKEFPINPSWVASQGKSHVLVVEALSGQGAVFHVEHPVETGGVGWLELPKLQLAPGEKKEWQFRIYAGPLALAPLREAGLEEALSFGAFSGVGRWLLQFLNWSSERLHSYGLAICLLSLAVWLPFSPLTWYSTKLSRETMQKMAVLKPQEARIRKEHQSNPQKMQQELMQLYRKHGVNPASGCIGCLPFLFTWPIYIALFQVLTRAPELRGAGFLWIRDLSAPDAFIRFPVSIPLMGPSVNLLPAIATVCAFFQQKMMQQPNTLMTEEQKMQQQVFKFMPLMFLFIFYQLPSGFMLYWVVNSLLMVGLQFFVARLPKQG